MQWFAWMTEAAMKILCTIQSFVVGEGKKLRAVSPSASFLLVPALFGLFSSALADTTFNYNCPAFTSILSNEPSGYPPQGAGTGPDSCNQPERDHPGVMSFCKAPPGDPLDVADYDTLMKVTGSFTLSDDENCTPPDWLANHRDGYDCVNNWMCLESYTFTDGRVEFSYSRLDDLAPNHVVKCFGPTIYAANPPTFPEPRITYWHIWLEYRPPIIYEADGETQSSLNIGLKSYFLSTKNVRNVTPRDYGKIQKCTYKEAGCTGFRIDEGAVISYEGAWSVDSTPTNEPPIADAGLDETVHVNTVVNLNGAASYDPDGHSLTYDWQLFLGETEVTEQLSDSIAVDPTFTADVLGPPNYFARLTVTDSEGLASATDEAIISTSNTAPVADAGPDQVVTLVESEVPLNGTASYDTDGDTITFDWDLTVRPAESAAELSDHYAAQSSFIPDVYGDYEASLVVNDGYADSDADSVLVSFNNVPPVAHAGGTQAVMVGDTVILEGIGDDENGDALTFWWSFVSMPEGSGAVLSDQAAASTTFVADTRGDYVVSLTVNDGFVDSETDNARIIATGYPSQIIENVGELIDVVNAFPTNALKNRKLSKAMTNKLAAVISMVDEGEFESAHDKLIHDFSKKMDGCQVNGMPDRNDWVVSCEKQDAMQPMLQECIEMLEDLYL
jgi:hypothetical protein